MSNRTTITIVTEKEVRSLCSKGFYTSLNESLDYIKEGDYGYSFLTEAVKALKNGGVVITSDDYSTKVHHKGTKPLRLYYDSDFKEWYNSLNEGIKTKIEAIYEDEDGDEEYEVTLKVGDEEHILEF